MKEVVAVVAAGDARAVDGAMIVVVAVAVADASSAVDSVHSASAPTPPPPPPPVAPRYTQTPAPNNATWTRNA